MTGRRLVLGNAYVRLSYVVAGDPSPIYRNALGDEVVYEPGLRVPHPRVAERRFVLEPLFELDPDLVVSGVGPVSALLAGLE